MRWIAAGAALWTFLFGLLAVIDALHNGLERGVDRDMLDITILAGSGAVVLGVGVLTVLAVTA